MKNLDKKLDKKETLWYSGTVLIVILIAFILNFILKFPLDWENIWIYGIISLVGGIAAYFISLYFLESYHFFLEIFSIIIIAGGEFLILAYFLAFERIWVSVYFIIPSVTFLGLAILTYNLHSPEIKDRHDISGGILVVTGALTVLVIETIVRGFLMFQLVPMHIIGTILLAGGIIFYIFVIWKILEKPNYIITLIGATIISIGTLLVEFSLKVYDPIFTTVFLAPGAIFFLLLLINYKILRADLLSKSQFSHQSGLTPKYEQNAEPESDSN